MGVVGRVHLCWGVLRFSVLPVRIKVTVIDIFVCYLFLKFRPNKWTLNVRARVAIRPVYSKLVLPSRKSLEIIINIKIKYKIKIKIFFL